MNDAIYSKGRELGIGPDAITDAITVLANFGVTSGSADPSLSASLLLAATGVILDTLLTEYDPDKLADQCGEIMRLHLRTFHAERDADVAPHPTTQ